MRKTKTPSGKTPQWMTDATPELLAGILEAAIGPTLKLMKTNTEGIAEFYNEIQHSEIWDMAGIVVQRGSMDCPSSYAARMTISQNNDTHRIIAEVSLRTRGFHMDWKQTLLQSIKANAVGGTLWQLISIKEEIHALAARYGEWLHERYRALVTRWRLARRMLRRKLPGAKWCNLMPTFAISSNSSRVSPHTQEHITAAGYITSSGRNWEIVEEVRWQKRSLEVLHNDIIVWEEDYDDTLDRGPEAWAQKLLSNLVPILLVDTL